MKKIVVSLFWTVFLSGCLMTRNDVEEVQQKKVMQDQVVSLQKNTADQQSRYNDINSELRDLNGKIEVLENKIMLMQQDREKIKKENEIAFAENNKKIAALQDEVTKLENQLASMASDVQTKSSNEKTPAGDANSQYDLAEDFYTKKEWKKAIFNFQKFREAHPKNKKIAEATLKIGIAFQELGMKDEAKTFLEEVLAKHPQSPSAKVAKARLKKLK